MPPCLGLLACLASLTQSPDLSFHPDPAQKEHFTFDTGKLKGIFLVKDDWEGVVSCKNVKSGTEITRGDGRLGLFHLYRLLSADKRWGDTIWAMPKTAGMLEDGSLVLHWPPDPAHPFEITATHRWSAPDTLDVRIELLAKSAASQLEVFVGTYLSPKVLPRMYLKPARYSSTPPEFAAVDSNWFLLGNYCMFPRDLAAARIIYDGRWLQGHNPVDWAISRYMALPLGLQHDSVGSFDVLLMADPASCFSVAMSYYLDPPDGVAAHRSTYFSLFGKDVKEGDTLTAYMRAVIGSSFSTPQALEQFEHFRAQLPEASRNAPAASTASRPGK